MNVQTLLQSWLPSAGLAQAQKPVDWLLVDLIEAGDQWIVSGPPKSGKSMFALSMAIKISKGESFIGYECPIPKTVLYFDLELKDRIFWSRALRMVNNDFKDLCEDRNLVRPTGLGAMDIFQADDVEKISTAVKMVKPDLIIWDVLSRLHRCEENDNGAMKKVLQRIRELSEKSAHVIVHHSRKNNVYGNADAQSMRGAGSIHGEVDGAITLTPKGTDTCNMSISARAIPAQKDRLLEWDESLNIVLPKAIPENDLTAILDKCLTQGEKLSSGELSVSIQNMVGCEDRQAKRIIAEARRLKLITGSKVGRHVYYEITKSQNT